MAKDKVVAGKIQQRTESSQLTPLMVQYQAVKDEYKNEVLFFRLGDFYEMFNDDAVEVSRLLNLTLTHRGGQPMCGIPYHAAKVYIARLLRLGKKIAICEQIGDVKGKTLAERKVIEVITPGTAVESEYLDGGANNYLASCFEKNGEVGFAYIDVTTADFFATSWKSSSMADNFAKELGRANPREILLPESFRTNRLICEVLEQNQGISVSYYPDWNFDFSLSFKRLTKQFKTQNLRSFGLTQESPEVAPAGFLLDYLTRTASTTAPHVSEIKIYKDCDYVVMDDSSRRNLEITSNVRDGSFQYSLLECVSHTQTAMGKRLLINWLNYPLTDSKKIYSRQEHVELFVKNRRLSEGVRQEFSSILDIERLAGRIAMERAHAKDLQALKTSLKSWLCVRALLENYDFALTPSNGAVDIIKLIDSSILDDPATSLTEGRIIKDGWSSELDRLRQINGNFNRILCEYAEEEKSKTGISNLRIKSNNNSGYYIEITKGKLQQVPEHFIMRRSLLNAERYTTAKLQELEQELNRAGTMIIELERDLFTEVRSKIATLVPYLLQTSREIAYTDVVSSLAHAAILHNWVRPEVEDSSIFEIKDGRHPVVELHLPGGEFVPNDISISCPDDFYEGCSTSFDLITGPNMAGKSTFLRQNALIALLAQTGSFVPASTAKLGIVDRIFCRVGASDNLARGESTFLVEMTETANILRTATKKSLVIMDEVGRGTSTEDGLSIAWAISEYLLNNIKCKTLFATHYHELTRMNHPALKLLCMAVSENSGAVIFLRKIKEGASENSYGLHVAKLAGVPENVIHRANEILQKLQKVAGEKPIVDENLSTNQNSLDFDKNLQRAPGLFSDEELVLDEILSSDIENTTPIQALQLISRWKTSLSGR
ncbi:DNA mismatch repair protein MutS [Treponema pectinovorum]|uniref:DNA mismatch repair protein MutS n=1 Tax=Treponema pectinovorum TaxID=164 RepID=UPI0011C7EEDA|nr:DNA mismatch repair protein MutS [Treponema pectinovorum]